MKVSHIKLTAFEYTIMETLIRNNGGKVVAKILLMLPAVSGMRNRGKVIPIDVLMGRLRKNIGFQYPHDVITNVRGQGYLLNCANE